MTKRKEIIGSKFTRLTVVKLTGDSGKGGPLYECLCDCGKTTIAAHVYLLKGTKKSCGCLKLELESTFNIKHGNSNHPLYTVYASMLGRCYTESNTSYPNYGGRGITVCDRWKESFESFVKDIGDKPYQEASIERVDNELGYSPENCIWASKSEQSFNKRIKGKHRGIRPLPLKSGEVKYTASITVRTEVIYLGTFETLEEAICARKMAEITYFGKEAPK